jgi:glycosyltransferase involved in cell wall biosynthesis
LRIESGAEAPHIAIVDGASFVLPYDHGLIGGLVRRGWRVTLFCSETRYNAEFLDALPAGVQVRRFAVSRTAAPRWRGAWNYLRLWAEVRRRRAEFDAVNLQFSILWPLERWFLRRLRERFVFTLHNPVPHGFAGERHGPTAQALALAARVVFISAASRADAERRYGPLPHAAVLPHGLVPVSAGDAPVPYAEAPPPQALVVWGNVAPYKGLELLLELARDAAWRTQGLPLELHGRFEPGLERLRNDLVAAGVTVVDRFLSADELRALTARPVVFLLPHRRATQSGALYTLLHRGCRVLCADSGDLGDFMRRHGLGPLLLADRTPAAVLTALDRLRADPTRWTAAFAAAQRSADWDASLAGAEEAYGLRKSGR